MNIKTTLFTLVLLLTLIITGCQSVEADPTATSPPSTGSSSEPVTGEATVESIQLLILESFPVQVNARVRGVFPDGCTTLDNITTKRTGNDFTINLTTFRPADAVCTEAEVPFDEAIGLDVLGLDAGTYTVTANGVNGAFTLDMDNRIEEESEAEPTTETSPTPQTVDPGTAVIDGIVWHDLCALADNGEEITPSEGCIATTAGDSFQANGLLEESEPPLEGIVLNLGEGNCPADGLATAVTDANGAYTFTDLPAGDYCVSIDALTAPNDDLLLPGGWTSPDSGEGLADITLAAEASANGINFGWDYEFLPITEVNQETCTRSIGFEKDLTVPDDTTFAPGDEFVKSWRLRNIGTCPWIETYTFVFVSGDQMSAPDTQPLPKVVAPGQTVDISVTLTAPEELGNYVGRWQISDANGDLFGVDGFVEEPIYTRITVGNVAATPTPNSAAIGGVIWDDVCFIHNDGTPSRGCVETEEGSNIFVADGSLNFNENRLSDVVINLSAGACPADGIVPAASVIDTAVTDSDGLYRLEGLDAGLYCVSVNAFSDDNVDRLIPGDWTWPAYGAGLIGINVDRGEEILNVDFGWQYQ